MYVYKQLPGSVRRAMGGPSIERPDEQVTSTRPGRFIIASIEQHVSARRWRYSTIPWGAPLRLNKQSFIEVQVAQKWRPLSSFPGWEGYATDPLKGFTELNGYYNDLVGSVKGEFGMRPTDALPADWGLVLPKTWVFNDFGPVAVKYFEDFNHNGKLDRVAAAGQKQEAILSDFLHTTPPDELAYTLSRQVANHYQVNLSTSHGCVHMDPAAMRQLVATGVLKVGAQLEIHPYSEVGMPPLSFERPTGRKGTQEMHFFPRAGQIAVYQVSEKQLGHSLHPAHG